MVRASLIVVLLAVVLIGLVVSLQPDAAATPSVTPTPTSESQQADIWLTISERRLGAEMERSLRDNPNILDPSLDLASPDRAEVTVTLATEILGLTLRVRPSVEMTFAVVDGEAVVSAREMQLGGLPVPSGVADVPMREFTRPMEEQINAAIQQVRSGSHLTLISITTTDDSLVLAFS